MLEIAQGSIKEERMKVNHLNAKSFFSDEVTFSRVLLISS